MGPRGETGSQGPPGERGPQGEPGGLICPEGFTAGELTINAPGGQITLYTCLQ